MVGIESEVNVMKKFSTTDIFCANCLHCKEFTEVSQLTGTRERRVRCAAGQWATAAGKQRTYSLHTVLSRRVRQCAHYESMGEEDRDEFLADLSRTLPVERVIEKIPTAQRKSA